MRGLSIDGSGKSTQLTLLAQWLRSQGHLVVFSEWNSSPIVRTTTASGKKRRLLTPLTFSLIHATDFSDRVERDIVPTMAIYFRVPLETALHRVLSGRPRLKWYEAGMDLNLHPDITESYKLFQARIQTEYERVVPEFGLEVMDATRPVEIQQRLLRQMVTPLLENPPARSTEVRP